MFCRTLSRRYSKRNDDGKTKCPLREMIQFVYPARLNCSKINLVEGYLITVFQLYLQDVSLEVDCITTD